MTEPNDKLLDEYLRRESPVSRRYRELDSQDVPPQLDAAVLARAHAAVANRNERRPNRVRWGAPLALAASAVMAVAIVVEVGVPDDVRMPAPQTERTTSAERAQEAHLIEEISPDAPVENAAAEYALLEASPQADVSAQERGQAPAEAADVERASERKVPPRANVAKETQRAVAHDATAPTSSVQPSSAAAPRQPAEEQEKIARDAADAASAAREEHRPDMAFARARTVVEPAPAQAAPSAALGHRTSMISAPPAEVVQQAPRLPPQEWLEQIRTLRGEGKVLEADEQWDEFRKTYPEFEVADTDAARPQP